MASDGRDTGKLNGGIVKDRERGARRCCKQGCKTHQIARGKLHAETKAAVAIEPSNKYRREKERPGNNGACGIERVWM